MTSSAGSSEPAGTPELPEYERQTLRMAEREALAAGFVQQIELTVGPLLARPMAECAVLDIGCGYGHSLVEWSGRARSAVGIEPSPGLAQYARELVAERGADNVTVREGPVGELEDVEAFDVAVLDNVLEHIDDQPDALHRLGRALRVGGVAYILVPNRLWPIEAHYGLPFLSYLPVPLADRYLQLTGRGTSYQDASYAPTVGRLRKLFAARPELEWRLTLPGDVSLAEGGDSPLYRYGVAALRRFPALWWISKSLLVVVEKRATT
ncbi:class I SAM-dependent methyltransferase [Actinomycetospora lemnae]|uniref:Class I SAM-dependent methyltransferase n=1 Tax=Actinomycetospora lemnae TaxID=3019891 RepID=A0ABT5SV69_9PSEU|nr:class I SAM-dependent methyltransferase [Actinomycetospora sp. DW7H6]MDD7966365.1 class I SAM-dependent methyltransferase [Actinomycetospora sp. DW7H6]